MVSSILKAPCSSRLAGAALAASSSSRPVTVPHGLAARPSTAASSRSAPATCTRSSASTSRSKRLCIRAQAGSATSTPAPVVKIDNISDPFATVVSVEWADKAATELLDTITAIKNLGLNIRRAQLTKKAVGNANTFYITDADTSEKIVRSARLEELRQTIISSLVAQFPDTANYVSTGASTTADLDMTRILGARRRMVQTTIDVSDAPNGSCSVLKIETRDRPGLLVDIVKVLKDINLNVVSAEVDTIGNLAKDEFFITYHGEPLPAPMVVLVTNALQYYLSLNEVAREESY